MEVDNWGHAENILKMKTFYTTKCKAYAQEKLNTLKGVIRSKELSLTTVEEIRAALGKQGVRFKRITIRKDREKIHTHTYILTFNQLKIPKEVKTGYCLERVEQYILAPLEGL